MSETRYQSEAMTGLSRHFETISSTMQRNLADLSAINKMLQEMQLALARIEKQRHIEGPPIVVTKEEKSVAPSVIDSSPEAVALTSLQEELKVTVHSPVEMNEAADETDLRDLRLSISKLKSKEAIEADLDPQVKCGGNPSEDVVEDNTSPPRLKVKRQLQNASQQPPAKPPNDFQRFHPAQTTPTSVRITGFQVGSMRK